VKRIGLIIPSSNRMVEQEMVRVLPAGVTAHVARLRMTGQFERPIEALLPAVADAAATLNDARCDAIAFHCTANSTSEGNDGEQRLLAAMAGVTSAPVTTTATAIREALDVLSVLSFALVTPYAQAVTEHEAVYFTDAGYRVTACTALGLAGSDAYCTAPPSLWEETLLGGQRPDADGYLLSCANISCFSVIDRVEARLKKPLVTSNQSVLWALLRAAQAPRPTGLGALMNVA
jgi:maleate isomerase